MEGCINMTKAILVQRNKKGQFVKQAVFELTDEAKKRKYGHFKGNKYGEGNKGKPLPDRMNEGNSQWKGDDVGYQGLHAWMHKRLGKATKCSNPLCEGKSKRFEWANKSHEYKRDLDDWIELCKSCHMKYDKVLEKRWKGHVKNEDKICLVCGEKGVQAKGLCNACYKKGRRENHASGLVR